ncbi:MAG: M48 family metalloprotease [Pseudomonadota bacterium]
MKLSPAFKNALRAAAIAAPAVMATGYAFAQDNILVSTFAACTGIFLARREAQQSLEQGVPGMEYPKEKADQIAKAMGLPFTPEIVVIVEGDTPYVSQNKIFLPQHWLMNAPEEMLDFIMAHENAHIARLDALPEDTLSFTEDFLYMNIVIHTAYNAVLSQLDQNPSLMTTALLVASAFVTKHVSDVIIKSLNTKEAIHESEYDCDHTAAVALGTAKGGIDYFMRKYNLEAQSSIRSQDKKVHEKDSQDYPRNLDRYFALCEVQSQLQPPQPH